MLTHVSMPEALAKLQLSPRDFAVLFQLVKSCNWETGIARIGNSKIASRACMSVSSVSLATASLIKSNVITLAKEGGGGSVNHYYIKEVVDLHSSFSGSAVSKSVSKPKLELVSSDDAFDLDGQIFNIDGYQLTVNQIIERHLSGKIRVGKVDDEARLRNCLKKKARNGLVINGELMYGTTEGAFQFKYGYYAARTS